MQYAITLLNSRRKTYINFCSNLHISILVYISPQNKSFKQLLQNLFCNLFLFAILSSHELLLFILIPLSWDKFINLKVYCLIDVQECKEEYIAILFTLRSLLLPFTTLQKYKL